MPIPSNQSRSMLVNLISVILGLKPSEVKGGNLMPLYRETVTQIARLKATDHEYKHSFPLGL
jgi:hypothetical protein